MARVPAASHTTQSTADISGVIRYLDEVESKPSKAVQNSVERIANKLSIRTLIFSVAVFALLCTAAFIHRYLYELPTSLLPWIIGLGVLSQLSALTALAMQTIAGMSLIFFFKREAITIRQNALDHDIEVSRPLLKHKPETLRHADAWLLQFINRQERWLNMFVPGSDKLAILSYFGATIAIFNQFMSTMSDTAKYVPWLTKLNINIDPFYLVIPLAMLFGFALAGVLTRMDIYRMQYKRDLISLALADPSIPKTFPATSNTKAA